MNYTQNYQLPQWVETDRILMEDFNDMTEKIDTAIRSRLGHRTLIYSTVTAEPVRAYTLDLSMVDWAQWEIVCITCRLSSIDGNLGLEVNNGETSAYGSGKSGYLFYGGVGPLALLFFPGHSASRQVRALCAGDPSGLSIAQCTYAEFDNLYFDILNTISAIPAGDTIEIWGIQ